MKDLMGMMKQVQNLQAKMAQVQEELGELSAEGRAGAGLVKVTLNGKFEMTACSIDASLLNPDEGEILEDLIVAATTDAKGKAEEAVKEKMAEVTGGLGLPPGMKLF